MDSTEEINVYLILFTGTLIMLLLACALIFFVVVYQKKAFLQQQQVYELQHSYQLELMNSNLQILENERKRMAEDLHDDVGAALSALRLQLATLGVHHPDCASPVAECKESIDRIISNIRAISYNLLPPTLELLGLYQAVEDLCLRLQKSSGTAISFKTEGNLVRLDAQAELNIYRIVQELLNNTLKHAGARAVQVLFSKSGTLFTLQYSDNGKGLSPERTQGLGLKSMESRVKMMKGSFYPAVPGEPFSVKIELPI